MITWRDVIFNFPTRTTSFEPLCISKTVPIGQCEHGLSFNITITRSSTLKMPDFEYHFLQIIEMGEYSRTHLLKNFFVTA